MKLLNLIESFCKTKIRQSVNINESNKTSAHNTLTKKSNCDVSYSPNKTDNLNTNDKCINKYLKKLVDEKM